MKYYPIFLDLRGKACVVIGGGYVAERKVLSLLDAGAKVKVISPEVTSTIELLAKEQRITIQFKDYAEGDLEGAFLAYSATDDREINQNVSEESQKVKTLLNVVDDPIRCDFIVPSIINRGDLVIATSTSGKSPAMARKIREELEVMFGDDYAIFLNLMGAIRAVLLKRGDVSDKNKGIFEMLARSPILGWIKEGKGQDVDLYLKEHVGEEFTSSSLKVDLGLAKK
jgi:precorrin-2 dehydrogenase